MTVTLPSTDELGESAASAIEEVRRVLSKHAADAADGAGKYRQALTDNAQELIADLRSGDNADKRDVTPMILGAIGIAAIAALVAGFLYAMLSERTRERREQVIDRINAATNRATNENEQSELWAVPHEAENEPLPEVIAS